MTLDLMVLMVGMEASDGSRHLAAQLGLDLAPNGFIRVKDTHYATTHTNVEGIYIAGTSSYTMKLTDPLTDER